MRYFAIILILTTTQIFASECDYLQKYCDGIIEHTLSDRTRVDCLTDTHAIEYDFQYKWAEAIGQSLHYSLMTNKKAGIVVICKSDTCDKYIDRINNITKHYKLDIDVWSVETL